MDPFPFSKKIDLSSSKKIDASSSKKTKPLKPTNISNIPETTKIYRRATSPACYKEILCMASFCLISILLLTIANFGMIIDLEVDSVTTNNMQNQFKVFSNEIDSKLEKLLHLNPELDNKHIINLINNLTLAVSFLNKNCVFQSSLHRK